MITAKDFYLLRTPYLPLQFLEQFNGLPHESLGERLKEAFADPSLQEAIYIASPELYGELVKWLDGQLSVEKDVNKLALSLYRYLLRMCTRCTPYGLFAGCAVGFFSQRSEITLAPALSFRKHSRLDMNYVAELAGMITRIPAIREQLHYYPNNSLYEIAGKYRFADYTIKKKFRNYHLTEVASTEYLRTILEAAREGARLDVLAQCIVSSSITKEEATAFIDELVESQLLVSELEPTVTGEEFFMTLLKRLHALQGAAGIAGRLNRLHTLLQDQSPGVAKYLQAHAIVKALLPDTASKDLIQTDLFLSTTDNTLSEAVIKDLQNQLQQLLPFARPVNATDLRHFKENFRERYEDQEVPLLVALDAEAGIGYAGYSGGHADHTPLVDDIFIEGGPEQDKTSWGRMHDFQLRKLYECLSKNGDEINLTDKDLAELQPDSPVSLPDSMYLMGSLLAKEGAAIDSGDYQFELNSCGGPSAATLLGRFCHGDETLLDKVKECLREEEQYNPDHIYAEVVHLPEARVGNILLRPRLRDYEIVYLGNGSVEASHQIPLSDLLVSVRANKVILRSKKLNKRVIPRLSTAHNFLADSLPAYKFLGDLQSEHVTGSIAWNWNKLKELPFLPRVRYKKIILSKCAWFLRKKDYPELTSAKSGVPINPATLFKELRERLKIPQHVVIVEGDNELLIDMNNESCLHILANTLIKKETVVLQEFLNTEERCFVKAAGARYTNEIIVPLKRTAGTSQQAPLKPGAVITERIFITGSEWLYAKIYCGTNSAERILKEVIRPLVQELEDEKLIDKWFFIRYADPEPHIRIRFHHTVKGFWKEVLDRLYSAMKESALHGLPNKIQLDTYQREIERYGANTIEISEDIFYYDSEAVIQVIDLLEGEAGEEFRWLLALRGVDMLLSDFGYQLEGKAALLKKLQQGFFREFSGNKSLNDQLNSKYRENMQRIRSFLNESRDAENGIEEAVALFTMRSIKLKKAASKIRDLQEQDDSTMAPDALVHSYIHMFLNRMILSNPRKHELVIYHYLSKYYDSQMAIQRLKPATVHHEK